MVMCLVWRFRVREGVLVGGFGGWCYGLFVKV